MVLQGLSKLTEENIKSQSNSNKKNKKKHKYYQQQLLHFNLQGLLV